MLDNNYSSALIRLLISAVCFMAPIEGMGQEERSARQAEVNHHDQLTSDTIIVDKYEAYIEILNQRDIATVNLAKDQYIKDISKLGPDACDRAFSIFHNYYNQMSNLAEETPQAIAFLKKLEEVHSMPESLQSDPFLKQLQQNGYQIYWTEGTPYIYPDASYLKKHFARFVSAQIVGYLAIREKEISEGFHDDCHLSISFGQLAGRVRRWERYIGNYPDSQYMGEADYYYHLYLRALLSGLANSPIFSEDTRQEPTLLPEVRKAYEEYIHKYPNTASSRLIGGYYELLKRNGFRHVADVDKYLAANKIEPLRNVQPPTR